eukprot:5391467-Prymnesium_polylepis.1
MTASRAFLTASACLPASSSGTSTSRLISDAWLSSDGRHVACNRAGTTPAAAASKLGSEREDVEPPHDVDSVVAVRLGDHVDGGCRGTQHRRPVPRAPDAPTRDELCEVKVRVILDGDDARPVDAALQQRAEEPQVDAVHVDAHVVDFTRHARRQEGVDDVRLGQDDASQVDGGVLHQRIEEGGVPTASFQQPARVQSRVAPQQRLSREPRLDVTESKLDALLVGRANPVKDALENAILCPLREVAPPSRRPAVHALKPRRAVVYCWRRRG